MSRFSQLKPTAVWICRGLILYASAVAAEVDVRRDATVSVVEQVMPSVVNILTRTHVERRGYFFDWWRDNWAPFVQELPPQTSAGSGVIIDEEGYVLTNVHVVEGADEIWVKLMDDREPLRAEPVVGLRKSDVALLRIKGKPGQRFKPVRLGADDDLLLGETVLALGNPFGLGGSVSQGILSAKSRRPPGEVEGALEVPDWLQTDAAINPGNSGGPLLNLRGEMIGINVAVYRQGQGIGFAIPVKSVNEGLSVLFTPEWIRQLWFGARFKSGATGLVVAEVQPGSPADKAGLKTGDRLVRINRRTPRTVLEANRELIHANTSEPVALAVERDRASQTIEVQLVPRSAVFNATMIRQKTGLTLKPLTAEGAQRLGLAAPEGFVIAAVDHDSPAASAGLQPGQVVHSLDGEIPRDLTAAAEILFAKGKGDRLELEILQQRQRGLYWETRSGVVRLTVR
jgi:serine protease Do